LENTSILIQHTIIAYKTEHSLAPQRNICTCKLSKCKATNTTNVKSQEVQTGV